MKNNTFRPILIVVCIIASLTACNKVLTPELKGSVDIDKLITTEEGAITLLNSSFQPLQVLYKGPMQRITDLASDDGWTWRNELEPDLFITTPSFSFLSTIWQNHYLGIGRVNTLLSNLDKIQNVSSDQHLAVLEGQAKFLRAFYYFNLVRLFGDVPLVVEQVVVPEDAELPRSAIVKVFEQIETDLTDAEKKLPETYTSASGYETGRPTTTGAAALKTLVFLEQEKWDSVVSASARVMGKGALLDNYSDHFNGSAENGKHSFFEVQYGGAPAATTTTLSSFYAPTSTPSGSALILPTDDNFEGGGGGPSTGNGIIQAFEAGDKRKETIVSTYGLPNFLDISKPDGSLYHVNKYYNTKDPVGLSSWNFPLIRYAEIILSRAEAMNEIAYSSEGEAFNLLNLIRSHAGLNALTSAELGNQEAFRVKLHNERRIELSFECKRFFDLNRTGKLQPAVQSQLAHLNYEFPAKNLVANAITKKPYFLYPIPASEFINNSKLGTQNPGYDN